MLMDGENLRITFTVIIDKNLLDLSYLNGNEAQDYVWLLSRGEMCVFPWNGICGSDLWDGWRQLGFNERLFDLGIGNWKVFSSCWFALLSNKVNTVYVPDCVCFFFLLSFFYPSVRSSPCCFLSSKFNISKWDLNKTRASERERVNEGEMTWIFCVCDDSLSPQRVDEREWRGEKHKQKENRLRSSIFPEPPDNSAAIDNQSLISPISLSLFLFCSILSSLSGPSMSPAKILNLLWTVQSRTNVAFNAQIQLLTLHNKTLKA